MGKRFKKKTADFLRWRKENVTPPVDVMVSPVERTSYGSLVGDPTHSIRRNVFREVMSMMTRYDDDE